VVDYKALTRLLLLWVPHFRARRGASLKDLNPDTTSLLNSVLARTAVERILNFPSWFDQSSGSNEYRFGQQLSQLSDGPSNCSKWLAIYELWQSDTRPVAESAFLADHTFLYK
jgi:hypothetical protein